MNQAAGDSLLQVLATAGKLQIPFENMTRIMTKEGMFSEIYKATCKETGLPVVLKFLSPNEVDEYRRRCFEREGRILAHVAGATNVVKLLHPPATASAELPLVGFETPLVVAYRYFGLALWPHSVLEHINSSGPLFSNTLVLFRDIVKGMSQLHARDICHRDLKPSNCFTDDRSAVVGDLGCARTSAASDDLGEGIAYHLNWIGDGRYVAPESFLGWERVQDFFRADFYSLGCILFECATGRILFDQMPEATNKLADARQFATIGGNNKSRERAKQVLNDLDKGGFLPKMGCQDPIPGPATHSSIRALFERLCRFSPADRLVDFNEVFRRVDTAISNARLEEKKGTSQ